MALNPIDKYYSFLYEHPEYKLSPQNIVLSVMVKEGKITLKEADELKGKVLFQYEFKNNAEDVKEIFGLNLTPKSERPAPYKTSGIRSEYKTHPYTSLVEVNDKGEIDINQFSLASIKAKYRSSEYFVEITQEEVQDSDKGIMQPKKIMVKNKKTNMPVVEYSLYETGLMNSIQVQTYNSDGSFNEFVNINAKKEMGILSNSKINGYYIKSHCKYNRDGSYNWTTFDFETGKIKEKAYYEKDRFSPYPKEISRTYYSNDKPYKTVKGEEVNQVLVKDLIKVLKRTSPAEQIRNPEIIFDVISRINENNVYEILLNYKKQTGVDLFDSIYEISDKISIAGTFGVKNADLEARLLFSKKTLDHVLSMMSKDIYRFGEEKRCEIEYLAQKMFDDINGLGSGNFNPYYINQFNIEGILLRYRELASEKHERYASNPLIPDKITKKFAPDESLLQAIMGETSLSKEQRIQYVMHIVENSSLISDEKAINEIISIGTSFILDNIDKNKYIDDIKTDMKLHEGNPKMLLVDLKRLFARNNCVEDRKVSKPNGKIDVNFRQGNTGDCWLVSGIVSCSYKPKGKEALESLLEVDEKTGDVTVTLRGVNKKYKLTFEEIQNANHLAAGDGDVRAIEIAFDKYMKEIAYSEEYANIDIQGNHEAYAYEVLFGNSVRVDEYKSTMAKDINKPNRIYSCGFSSMMIEDYNLLIGAFTNSKGEKVNAITEHAYAVIKTDSKYVYLVNPHDSSDVLKCTHETMERLHPSLGYVEFTA